MILEINDNNKKDTNLDVFSSKLNNYIQKAEPTFSVDKFEGDFAVCENRQTGEIINIPRTNLPEHVLEGSILKFENGKYILDFEATIKEQQEVKKIVDNLFKRKK